MSQNKFDPSQNENYDTSDRLKKPVPVDGSTNHQKSENKLEYSFPNPISGSQKPSCQAKNDGKFNQKKISQPPKNINPADTAYKIKMKPYVPSETTSTKENVLHSKPGYQKKNPNENLTGKPKRARGSKVGNTKNMEHFAVNPDDLVSNIKETEFSIATPPSPQKIEKNQIQIPRKSEGKIKSMEEQQNISSIDSESEEDISISRNKAPIEEINCEEKHNENIQQETSNFKNQKELPSGMESVPIQSSSSLEKSKNEFQQCDDASNTSKSFSPREFPDDSISSEKGIIQDDNSIQLIEEKVEAVIEDYDSSTSTNDKKEEEEEDDDSGEPIHDGFSDVEDEIPAVTIDKDLDENIDETSQPKHVRFINLPTIPERPQISVVNQEILCDFAPPNILVVLKNSKVSFLIGNDQLKFSIRKTSGCAITEDGKAVVANQNSFNIICSGSDIVSVESPLCPVRSMQGDLRYKSQILVHAKDGSLYIIKINSDNSLNIKTFQNNIDQFHSSTNYVVITRNGVLEVRDRTESGFVPIYTESLTHECQIGCDNRFIYVFDPVTMEARLINPINKETQTHTNIISLFTSSGGAALLHRNGLITVCGQRIALLPSTKTVAFIAVYKRICAMWESSSTAPYFKKIGKKNRKKIKDPIRKKALMVKENDDRARIVAQYIKNIEMAEETAFKELNDNVSKFKENLEQKITEYEKSASFNAESVRKIKEAAIELCATPEDAVLLYQRGDIENAFALAAKRSPAHCIRICGEGRLDKEAAGLPSAILIALASRLIECIRTEEKSQHFLLKALSSIDQSDPLVAFAMKTISPKLFNAVQIAKPRINESHFNNIISVLKTFQN